MSAQHTPGPWRLCHHLKSMECDQACPCGYRGVIYGNGEHGDDYAICQPGHEPPPVGQEGTEPPRYPREVELANARLIAAAPELLEALDNLLSDMKTGIAHTTGCYEAACAVLAKAKGEA